ncbi:MAG: SidA/IucD/PvdA family monooxygenase, partial [Myxococcota bacterium]
ATGPDGRTQELLAEHLALGIGTAPYVPECMRGVSPEKSAHSSAYLDRVNDMMRCDHVTVVGSGQSGAEVFIDLLRRGAPNAPRVSWLTRTCAFSPLDYSKLVLEMTTPEYVDYFHALPEQRRNELVAEQWRHYKGISGGTIDEIHEELYRRLAHSGQTGVELRYGVSIETVREESGLTLTCRHRDTDTRFEHHTDFLVTATGYRHRPATFLEPVEGKVARDRAGRWQIRRDHSLEMDPEVGGRIFVANADLHSHGVAAPDLGIGAYRSAIMLNSVLEREVFTLPKSTAFSQFSPPVSPDSGAPSVEHPRAKQPPPGVRA